MAHERIGKGRVAVYFALYLMTFAGLFAGTYLWLRILGECVHALVPTRSDPSALAQILYSWPAVTFLPFLLVVTAIVASVSGRFGSWKHAKLPSLRTLPVAVALCFPTLTAIGLAAWRIYAGNVPFGADHFSLVRAMVVRVMGVSCIPFLASVLLLAASERKQDPQQGEGPFLCDMPLCLAFVTIVLLGLTIVLWFSDLVRIPSMPRDDEPFQRIVEMSVAAMLLSATSLLLFIVTRRSVYAYASALLPLLTLLVLSATRTYRGLATGSLQTAVPPIFLTPVRIAVVLGVPVLLYVAAWFFTRRVEDRGPIRLASLLALAPWTWAIWSFGALGFLAPFHVLLAVAGSPYAEVQMRATWWLTVGFTVLWFLVIAVQARRHRRRGEALE